MTVIYNGYDEKDFKRWTPTGPDRCADSVPPFTLLHSGVLYRDIRNPLALFQALAALKESDEITASKLQVILRSPGSIKHYKSELSKYRIEDVVKLEPALPYSSAVEEIMRADGLMLLQGQGANRQIPTKLFEYFRAQKPILALVDENGDTAKLIRSHDAGILAPIEDPGAITTALRDLLSSPGTRSERIASPATVRQYMRDTSADMLAARLNSLL